MPVLKKPVYDAVKARLEGEQNELRAQIRRTRYDMKQIVEKQTLAKRQLAALGELIRSLTPKP